MGIHTQEMNHETPPTDLDEYIHWQRQMLEEGYTFHVDAVCEENLKEENLKLEATAYDSDGNEINISEGHCLIIGASCFATVPCEDV